MKKIVITSEILRSGKNSNKVMNAYTAKANAILDKYREDDNNTTIGKTLSDVIALAKFNAVLDFVSRTLGDSSPYVKAIEKSFTDDSYRDACANTKDTSSIEWFVGRVYAGKSTDIGNVISRILGSAAKKRGLQIKRLAHELANAAWLTEEFYASNYGIVEGNVQMLYANTYPAAVAEDAIKDTLQMAMYIKKGREKEK